MVSFLQHNWIRRAAIAALFSMVFTTASLSFAANGTTHSSKPFMGAKANTGTVTHTREGTKNFLTLSDDFKVPDTPAPHWQIVDSKGNVYLLQRLMIKGDKYNKRIEVPAYIRDIAKVQIWCAWAETLLGEASFDQIVKL